MMTFKIIQFITLLFLVPLHGMKGDGKDKPVDILRTLIACRDLTNEIDDTRQEVANLEHKDEMIVNALKRDADDISRRAGIIIQADSRPKKQVSSRAYGMYLLIGTGIVATATGTLIGRYLIPVETIKEIIKEVPKVGFIRKLLLRILKDSK